MDSVYRVVSRYYSDIMRELSEHESDNVIYIITTGAYIEAFYIALNLVDEYYDNSILLRRIAEEKFSLYSLNKYSNLNKEDYNVSSIIKYQDDLLEIFNTFSIEESTPRTFKINAQGKLELTGGDKIMMNEEQFKKLKKTVERIRVEITNQL